MHRSAIDSAAVAAGLFFCALSALDAAPARADAAPAATTTTSPSNKSTRGIVVLAAPGAEAPAWALAKEAYADDALRPPTLDEARARILAGQPPAADASRALRDLADQRAGVRGEDGASRALLATIAGQLGVRAVVVVTRGADGAVSARVFVTESGTFDAARYAPEPPEAEASAPAAASNGAMDAHPDGGTSPAPIPRWTGTVASLERAFTSRAFISELPASESSAPSGAASPTSTTGTAHAPPLATSAAPEAKPKPAESHPFYTSPWFWGAVGAAAFGGAAVYFATRDNTPTAIHLQLQVH
jgi:hypothetical protein